MILIVDDHLDSCEPLKRLLTMVGVPAECVQSGPDALAFMRSVTTPDAVVLDVRMPGMSGLDVLKEVRNDPNLYHVPVMMYSADYSDRDRQEAMKLGANDYVPKAQLEWPELLDRINHVYQSDIAGQSPATFA
jgi:CheY-like chemotaxis protein